MLLRRRLALLVAGVAVMTQVAMPPSSAEDLGDRRQRITREIDRGQAELDQSSARLSASIRGLQTAEMALDTARSTLAKDRCGFGCRGLRSGLALPSDLPLRLLEGLLLDLEHHPRS